MCHGFTKKLRHIPAPLQKSLIYDRGKEMAEHEPLAQRLAIRVFFADLHSPWQRGTNEKTNELRRQYLPKGTRFIRLLLTRIQRDRSALKHAPQKILELKDVIEVFPQLRYQYRWTWIPISFFSCEKK